jgi:hypothetical protein
MLPDMPATADSALACGFGVNPVGEHLMDAWLRMMRLLERPEEITVLAPLIEQEILFRILQGASRPLAPADRWFR